MLLLAVASSVCNIVLNPIYLYLIYQRAFTALAEGGKGGVLNHTYSVS